jgi:hypothetical protein
MHAHELVHIVQQGAARGGASPGVIQRKNRPPRFQRSFFPQSWPRMRSSRMCSTTAVSKDVCTRARTGGTLATTGGAADCCMNPR